MGVVMRLVTVCTANLCRSPLAEHALREAAAGRVAAEVLSTGVDVRAGRESPKDWCEVVGAYGFDLRNHRARVVDLSDADLIIAMTAGHLRQLAVREPSLLGRLVTLGGAVARLETEDGLTPSPATSLAGRCGGEQRAMDLLRADDRLDVADPYRRPPAEQRRVALEIIDLARRFIAGISR